MDKDKPPPFASTVQEVLEDFWRRRALTEKEQREERSPVSSQGSNESTLDSESEDEDDDADGEMDDDEEEHEEIETEDENDDGMDEDDEEENREAFCRACGNNDGADEFWICCDICKKRFHGNCVRFTPALAKEQKKCPLCRART